MSIFFGGYNWLECSRPHIFNRLFSGVSLNHQKTRTIQIWWFLISKNSQILDNVIKCLPSTPKVPTNHRIKVQTFLVGVTAEITYRVKIHCYFFKCDFFCQAFLSIFIWNYSVFLFDCPSAGYLIWLGDRCLTLFDVFEYEIKINKLMKLILFGFWI